MMCFWFHFRSFSFSFSVLCTNTTILFAFTLTSDLVQLLAFDSNLNTMKRPNKITEQAHFHNQKIGENLVTLLMHRQFFVCLIFHLNMRNTQKLFRITSTNNANVCYRRTNTISNKNGNAFFEN